ncbi:type I-E CRISPR-associated protein Cse2/CasB [Jonesia quinghaiensis]|uniref:type I-E CRISPR-associated protein Cse2/CasB n=1 Tax=Jonesia quinghaiensis TaxID=262806 RepID=UPI000409EE6C|nr:type I-E CRISPR-associated protein Cse2/CasB [Jonesia quinghaiensis]
MTTPDSDTKKTSFHEFVGKKVNELYRSSAHSSTSRGTLAALRRAAGKRPGETPEIWDITMSGLAEYDQNPWVRRLQRSAPEAPTPHESAAHIVLCLYATHQQSQANNMNDPNTPLGRAIQRLHATGRESGGLNKRFTALATSQDIDEAAFHLRGIVTLLRRQSIPLDYAQLARDLVNFQDPERRGQVLLRWSRDFHRTRADTQTATPETATETLEGEKR